MASSSSKDNGDDLHRLVGMPADGGDGKKRTPDPSAKDIPVPNSQGESIAQESNQPAFPTTSNEKRGSRPESRIGNMLTWIGICVGIMAGIAGIITFILTFIAPSVQQVASPAATASPHVEPSTIHATTRVTAPPGSYSENLTADIVRKALLNPSELAVISSSFKASDIQPSDSSSPSSASCSGGITHPIYSVARIFKDDSILNPIDMIENIDAFTSRKAAQNAYSIDSRTVMCGFQSHEITSTVAGLL